MSEIDKKKMMYSDNRIFDLGVDDMSAFDEFIAELGGDLDVPGFDDELLRSLVADEAEVDEMLSGYGLITEEKKEQMATAADTYRNGYEPGQINTIVDVFDYYASCTNLTISDGGAEAADDEEYFELMRASMDGYAPAEEEEGAPEALPLDMDKVTLTLWAVE